MDPSSTSGGTRSVFRLPASSSSTSSKTSRPESTSRERGGELAGQNKAHTHTRSLTHTLTTSGGATRRIFLFLPDKFHSLRAPNSAAFVVMVAAGARFPSCLEPVPERRAVCCCFSRSKDSSKSPGFRNLSHNSRGQTRNSRTRKRFADHTHWNRRRNARRWRRRRKTKQTRNFLDSRTHGNFSPGRNHSKTRRDRKRKRDHPLLRKDSRIPGTNGAILLLPSFFFLRG